MGPAVESPEKAAELIAAGMNVARLISLMVAMTSIKIDSI